MWLLLNDELQCRDAVYTLLSLLILRKRIILEEPLQSCFSNNAYERYELRVGLVGTWML